MSTPANQFSSSSGSKIPPFDEKNFLMWKSKAMIVLETLDYEMLDVVENGPIIPMFQPMKDNVKDGEPKEKPSHEFDENDKRQYSLDVRGRAAIINSLPYDVYHLVQNCKTSKEIMDTLTVAYEGTEEVKSVNKNSLNRQYEHFFAKRGETLTQSFNRFNCLANDMRRLGIHKSKQTLVLKFLDSLNDEWEHHVDVLKNSEKIESMSLSSMFGNLRNYEETKIMRKEIMKESHKDRSVALYSRKKAIASDSDSDSSEVSEEDSAYFVKRSGKFDRRASNSRRFPTRHDYSAGKSSDFQGKKDSEPSKRNRGEKDKCFNCGSTDHYARDCKEKKSSEEDYETKYKKLVAQLKRQNINLKVLVAETEEWVEDEDSTEDEGKNDKCLMAKIEETTDSSSSSTFTADLSAAARNSASSDWDSSSLYQVKNFVTYSSNEKNDMFEYLCLHLSTSNAEKLVFKNEIKALKENILEKDKQVSQMKTMISNLSLTNKFLHTEKDIATENSDKLQRIINNWAHSHNKLNKILSDQIPDQCAKIIGGQIDEAVAKFEQINSEQNFPTSAELASDFKTRFVSNSFINQNLINKHCVTDPHGLTTCATRLTALDPTIRNHADKYPAPTTECYLKFPISNGEVHSTKENLANFPDCSVMPIKANDPEHSQNHKSSSHLTSDKLTTPDPPSTAAHTHTPSAYSTPSSHTSSARKKPCRSKSPTQTSTYYTLKVCYRCGDSSHKISDCTFDVNSRRIDNLKLRTDKWTRKVNSLNCLPSDCYSIFQ